MTADLLRKMTFLRRAILHSVFACVGIERSGECRERSQFINGPSHQDTTPDVPSPRQQNSELYNKQKQEAEAPEAERHFENGGAEQ